MWPFHSRKRDKLHGELLELSEIVQRLEIAQRKQKLALDELSGDVEKLSERLNGQLGRILGGGAGRPPKARPGDGETLEDIPKGDKAALRRWFADHPPKEVKPVGVTSE